MQRAVLAFLLAVAAAVLGLAPAAQAQQFPKLTGRVVDEAGVLPADVEARIAGKLEALETQSQRQLVVATVRSLQDYDIADYGYRLGRQWGIGAKDRNDGALLLVAPNERKVRIEVGYGLEPVLTDALSFLIVNDTMLPRFRQGDMAGGIEAGADAIIHQLQLPEAEARNIAAQAAARPQQGEDGMPDGAMIFLMILFFLFFVMPAFSARRRLGRQRRGGLGPVVVWGGGSGWGGGSSWGGGGFSGGGGSFGGGGASGSW